MRYLSVCSGIEAATVAWHPLGWEPIAFAEIDAFPSAVLAHHYPAVPNAGDFTEIGADVGAVDLLVGGTPCQDFSVAGLRAGLAGDRGALTIEFVRLAERVRPRWLVWENVPGVLSADEGRAFGTFLGLLGECGYGFAYRVLDAQYFGVPQRRRRVFVVGYFGDWRRAAAVLFECSSLSGHPAPSREAREVSPTRHARRTAGGGLGTDFDCDGGLIANALSAQPQDYWDPSLETYVVGQCHGTTKGNGSVTGGVQVAVAYALGSHAGAADGDQTNRSHAAGGPVGSNISEETAYSLRADRTQAVTMRSTVRRLTPRECERLQGFPDDYTLVPYRNKSAADGPRYRALGNSMAVPVMAWLGKRIQEIA